MAKTMRMLFLIMVTVGLSMEFYAVVVCKSALLAQIHTENLIISCLIIGGWQLVCLAAGNYIGILLNIYRFTTAHHAMNALLSIVIFLLIAVHMAKSAWKNESILEKRINDIELLQITVLSIHFGLYTLLTGVALSLMSIPFSMQAVVFAAVLVLVLLLAFYTGYRFGYKPKTKAYMIGCALLILSSVCIAVRLG